VSFCVCDDKMPERVVGGMGNWQRWRKMESRK